MAPESNHIVRRLLATAALCAALSVPALAQFQVTGFSPENGTANVPTLTTLQWTFSEPLDATVQFPASDGFYLVVEMYPDAGGPLDLRLTGDGTVLDADFQLAADTQYWLILHDARSTGGASLDRVYYHTFTTAPSIPSGSISGQVTMDSTPVAGALVQAIAPDSLFADYDTQIGGYAVTDASGNYHIDHVPAGLYTVIAFTDDDRDTEPTPGEALGSRDADGDRLLDGVEVAEGASVTGADIAVETLAVYTASQFAEEAGVAASTLLPGEPVQAVGAIGVEMDPVGMSFAWVYLYRGQTTDTPVSVFEIGGWFIPGGPGMEGLELTVPVPAGWVDSNAALATAESSGGAEFRASFPETRIMAILAGTSALFGGGGGGAGKRAPEDADISWSTGSWRTVESPTAPSIPGAESTGHPAEGWLDPVRSISISLDGPTWFILYNGGMESRTFLIDAVTGDLIGAPGTPTVAGNSLAAALEAAVAWMSDAELAAVGAAGGDGVSEGGLSPYWSYGFYSPGSGAALQVTATAGLVVSEEEIPANNLPSTEALPETWIDSDAAAAVAEANSGGYRASHDQVFVQAILSKGFYPGSPGLAVWVWIFNSQVSPDQVVVYVDAVTGAIVTSTERPDVPGPVLTLDSPYPNPASDEAYASVSGTSSPGTRMVVEDLLGRRVADLGELRPAAGDETVRIDTGSWPSGVYFVRLVGPGQSASRKLVVVR